MILHGYWRSSASYRVRIALNLKDISVEHRAVNLREGEQLKYSHQRINPQPFVPVLELEDGTLLTQSVAIIDYLESAFPNPKLLPMDPVLRSKIFAASQIITSDIAPIQNLRVLKYLRGEFDSGDKEVRDWCAHWITEGFKSLEALASTRKTECLYTHDPSLFECCLIPQIYNAKRFGVEMDQFPNLQKIQTTCQIRPAFERARPENQEDAI